MQTLDIKSSSKVTLIIKSRSTCEEMLVNKCVLHAFAGSNTFFKYSRFFFVNKQTKIEKLLEHYNLTFNLKCIQLKESKSQN